jgi:hypothetical protein
MIIAFPYTAFYSTSNWTLEEQDMPAIQLYIDHFQYLYPELVSCIVIAHGSSPRNGLPRTFDFWPTRRKQQGYSAPVLGTGVTMQYQYSQITGLFIALEIAGWSRRTLLTFLRDKVEQRSGLVRPEEKEAFAVVMEKLCTHNFRTWLEHFLFSGPRDFLTEWTYVRLRDWDGDVPMGMRAIRVSLDSVDWVLERGAFLIPQDIKTCNCMKQLAAELRMWRTVKNAEELQMGLRNYWQIMAAR